MESTIGARVPPAQGGDGPDRVGVMVAPDVLAVHKTRKHHFILWESIIRNELCRLHTLDKIEADAIKGQRTHVAIAVANITKVGLEQHAGVATRIEDGRIEPSKQSDIALVEVSNQPRLVKLNPPGTRIG